MFLQLDSQGPRYAQLTRALKHAILTGRCAPATRLPATRSLARDLDLSRNTVLAAYEQLAAEGFIEGRIGSGCYVAEFAQGAAVPQPAPARPAAPRKAEGRASRLSRRGQRMAARVEPRCGPCIHRLSRPGRLAQPARAGVRLPRAAARHRGFAR